MKAINFKTNLNFLIVGSLVMMPVLVISQTTITSNTRTVPTAFLGWNSSGLPGSVDLRNDFLGSYPLNFFTGGNSTANQRMTILGSAGNGYVGIGSGFSTPQALLHINGYANAGNTGEVFRSSGPDDDINAWRMYTGINNGSEKMSLFVTPNFSDPYNNNNATIQAPEGNITFNPGGNFETMRIAGKYTDLFPATGTSSYSVFQGNVGIVTKYPLALLQVGPEVMNDGSYRDWMQQGVLHTYQGMTSFLGMRKLSADDEAETVLSWSNFYKQKVNSLKFKFTQDVPFGTEASDRDGINVAEMISDGFATGSRMGVGGTPVRRLESFDRGEDAPQLRLTYTYRNEFDGFTYTDFQTTRAGDLFIEPRITDRQGNVGIGIFSPSEKIDVNGGGRFRDIPDRNQSAANALMIGEQAGATLSDLTLRKLAFTGNSTDVLLGTGVFGPAPGTAGGIVTANNGLTLTTPSNVQLGGSLLHTTSINMNNNNLDFSGSGGPNNRVGIGGTSQQSLLTVVTNDLEYAGLFLNQNPHGAYGMAAGIYNGVPGGNYYGINTYSSSMNALRNVGLVSTAGHATDANVGATITAYQIVPSTPVALQNIGVEIIAGTGSSANYGITSTAFGPAGSTNYAGYFNGAVYATGTIISSDQRFKSEVQDIPDAMQIIRRLRPRTYYFNHTYPTMQFSPVKQWGFIAQEVAPVLPELVSDNIQPPRYDSAAILYTILFTLKG